MGDVAIPLLDADSSVPTILQAVHLLHPFVSELPLNLDNNNNNNTQDWEGHIYSGPDGGVEFFRALYRVAQEPAALTSHELRQYVECLYGIATHCQESRALIHVQAGVHSVPYHLFSYDKAESYRTPLASRPSSSDTNNNTPGRVTSTPLRIESQRAYVPEQEPPSDVVNLMVQTLLVYAVYEDFCAACVSCDVASLLLELISGHRHPMALKHGAVMALSLLTRFQHLAFFITLEIGRVFVDMLKLEEVGARSPAAALIAECVENPEEGGEIGGLGESDVMARVLQRDQRVSNSKVLYSSEAMPALVAHLRDATPFILRASSRSSVPSSEYFAFVSVLKAVVGLIRVDPGQHGPPLLQGGLVPLLKVLDTRDAFFSEFRGQVILLLQDILSYQGVDWIPRVVSCGAVEVLVGGLGFEHEEERLRMLIIISSHQVGSLAVRQMLSGHLLSTALGPTIGYGIPILWSGMLLILDTVLPQQLTEKEVTVCVSITKALAKRLIQFLPQDQGLMVRGKAKVDTEPPLEDTLKLLGRMCYVEACAQVAGEELGGIVVGEYMDRLRVQRPDLSDTVKLVMMYHNAYKGAFASRIQRVYRRHYNRLPHKRVEARLAVLTEYLMGRVDIEEEFVESCLELRRVHLLRYT